MRVLFFGMECSFSRPPLAALLAADGVEVCAVVLPRAPGAVACGDPIRLLAPPTRRRRELPLVRNQGALRDVAPPGTAGSLAVHRCRLEAGAPNGSGPSHSNPLGVPRRASPAERGVVGMARAAHVPVYDAGRLADARTLAALAALRPDVIVVACFPRLLPPALLRLPRYGAFNIHPSLLPRYRGPSPLFWVFHDGLEYAGVTVHAMDAGADTGDIAAQAPLALPDGISYADAERRCAEEGARLLLESLDAIAAGTMMRRPQQRVDVPAAPVPADADFIITPDWPARRAFNFIRGVGGWGQPISISVGEERFIVREAVSFTADATTEDATMSASLQRRDRRLGIRCSAGMLTVIACSAPLRP